MKIHFFYNHPAKTTVVKVIAEDAAHPCQSRGLPTDPGGCDRQSEGIDLLRAANLRAEGRHEMLGDVIPPRQVVNWEYNDVSRGRQWPAPIIRRVKEFSFVTLPPLTSNQQEPRRPRRVENRPSCQVWYTAYNLDCSLQQAQRFHATSKFPRGRRRR
jgi:hypothetical protein